MALDAVVVGQPDPAAVGVDGIAEQLVLEIEQGAAARREVPTTREAHGLRAGGPVERLGDRGPPVDHDRLLVAVGDAHSADVERLGVVVGVGVEATEDQRVVAQIELVQPIGDVALDHLPFPPGLLGAALAHLDHGTERLGAIA